MKTHMGKWEENGRNIFVFMVVVVEYMCTMIQMDRWIDGWMDL